MVRGLVRLLATASILLTLAFGAIYWVASSYVNSPEPSVTEGPRAKAPTLAPGTQNPPKSSNVSLAMSASPIPSPATRPASGKISQVASPIFKAPDTPATPKNSVTPAPISIDALRENLQLAEKTLESAKSLAMARIKASPAYVAERANSEKKRLALEDARASGSAEQKLDASAAYVKSLGALKKLERAAAWDSEVQKASVAVNDAHVRLDEATADQDAKIAAAARRLRESIEADPVRQAIKQNRIIRGMTYNQCCEAVGRPYSVTDGGRITSATWKFGVTYWSVIFVDGKADTVTSSVF